MSGSAKLKQLVSEVDTVQSVDCRSMNYINISIAFKLIRNEMMSSAVSLSQSFSFWLTCSNVTRPFVHSFLDLNRVE